MDWEPPLVACLSGFIFAVVLMSFYFVKCLTSCLIQERKGKLVLMSFIYLFGLFMMVLATFFIYSLV